MIQQNVSFLIDMKQIVCYNYHHQTKCFIRSGNNEKNHQYYFVFGNAI